MCDLSMAPVSNKALPYSNPLSWVCTYPSWIAVTLLSRMLFVTLAIYLSTEGVTPWRDLADMHEQYPLRSLDGSSNVGNSSTSMRNGKFPTRFVASTDAGSIDALPAWGDSRLDHCTNFSTNSCFRPTIFTASRSDSGSSLRVIEDSSPSRLPAARRRSATPVAWTDGRDCRRVSLGEPSRTP